MSEYGILLVEDDSNDIFLIKRAFRQSNLVNPVQIVKDGDEAIAYLQGKQQYADREQYPLPALILLDLKLPRRSGLEVLDWLKQQPLLRRIPVIVLTASQESVDVNRAYDCGISSYLLKPTSFHALLQIVKSLDIYWLKLNTYPSVQPI